ncbi:hypothetical protein LTLLF_111985 [Microtus ochrogaster]|uniref:Uncharacterized protein n=1 Tax=Microtus ochrogaster TaxID=79684 RepID=A0A8J6GZ04_MICOH|nr:hypothetical protein LTLLF_111985 [Microtus ochrogaster]
MAIVKGLLDYIRLNVPSSDATIQAEEFLSVLLAQESLKDFGWLFRATTPEVPMQDVSGTGETLLHLRPASVTGYIGDLKPQEDTEFIGPAVEEPTLPEAGRVQFLTLEKPLPKSADTQSPIDVAANAPTARQVFLSAVVQLGAHTCLLISPKEQMPAFSGMTAHRMPFQPHLLLNVDI